LVVLPQIYSLKEFGLQVLSKREGLECVLLTELAASLTELVAPQMLLSFQIPDLSISHFLKMAPPEREKWIIARKNSTPTLKK
jgi:hypothetical protein